MCPIPCLPKVYGAGWRKALVSNQRSSERSEDERFGFRRMAARSCGGPKAMAVLVAVITVTGPPVCKAITIPRDQPPRIARLQWAGRKTRSLPNGNCQTELQVTR